MKEQLCISIAAIMFEIWTFLCGCIQKEYIKQFQMFNEITKIPVYDKLRYFMIHLYNYDGAQENDEEKTDKFNQFSFKVCMEYKHNLVC